MKQTISLKEKIDEVIKRAKQVSNCLLETVEGVKQFDDLLFRYFTSTIVTDDDYQYFGKPLFAGEMCDNLLLQAGISTLGPLRNVVFLSTSFYPWMRSSMERYMKAEREKGRFRYDIAPYNMLIDSTCRFKSIPTIFLPVSESLHWGYLVVIPEPGTCRAVMMWGDSLRTCAPPGLMESFRFYLLLIYRGVTFVISPLNHALDVLGFSKQLDGFSCGFYVLAAMARFSSASADKFFHVCGFAVYDAKVTEQYREVCIRSLVLHVMCVGTSTPTVRNVGIVEVSSSLRKECQQLVDAVNNSDLSMYPGLPSEQLALLAWENSCDSIQGVTVITDDKDMKATTGLVSRLYLGDGDKPFLSTSVIVPERVSLSFADGVDTHTVWNVTCNQKKEQQLEEGFAQPEAAKSPSTALITTTGPSQNESPDGVILSQVFQVADTPHNGDCKTPIVQHEGNVERTDAIFEPGLTGLKDGDNVEEACHNIFAYLSQRLQEGHLLRKPEYQQYKGIDFRFRLRLRCRFYDPPPKWSGTAESYQRCQVRLYARVLKNQGGWRVSFRHNHNHEIWTHARLGSEDILRRMKAFRTSLCKHYCDAEKEFESWMRGERFGGYCPAVDGAWVVPLTDAGSRYENKAPDPTSTNGLVLDSYMDIAPRPENERPPQERFDFPVELVSPLESPARLDANLCTGVANDSEFIPLSVEYTDALRNYVQSCVVTCDGRDVKEELKYISECFGFPMIVRTSKYFHSPSDVNRTASQVQQLKFRCPVGHNTRLQKECKYWFTVVSSASKFIEVNGAGDFGAEGDADTLWRPLFINCREKWHTHRPDEGSLRRCLPPEVWREAINLKDKSLINTNDIARYVEDKYSLRLNRRVLSRKLRWEMGKRHPAERDCQKLVSNLLRYAHMNPGMFCEARLNDDNALHSVCWGFPQWSEEYKQFGIIPGVTIDAKAIANNYDTPLAIICGRTNNRAVTIFFMGFLASQREEEFLWFVGCFKKFVTVAPRLVACDQDSAIINSLEKVFPSTLVILDDWHLSKNQLKNTTSLAKELGDGSEAKEISKALWGLRKPQNEAEFFARRRNFEEQYLRDIVFPRWYNSLYYTNYRLVVQCYNRSTCGERFLFQGSGYAEAANSQYRRVIMEKKVPLARVPEEVLRYMEKRVSERRADLSTKKFSGKMASISISQLGYDEETWERVLGMYVPFAWDIITKESISLAHRYTVRSCERLVHEVYGEVLSFMVADSEYGSTHTRLYTIMCPKKHEVYSFIPHMCTCHWSNSAGLPCRHAARVAVVYKEYAGDNGRFPLELMFHHYWRKDRVGWSDDQIMRIRLGGLTPYGISPIEEETNQDEGEEEERNRRDDRLRNVMWNNGHSTWNQMHQRVSRKGIGAMKSLDQLMALLFQEIVKADGSDELDIALITRRLKEAVDSGNGSTVSPRTLGLSSTGQALQNESVKNSNTGKVKGRGTSKRAKSWTEKPGLKKTKKNVKGTDKAKDPTRKVRFLLNGSASQPTPKATEASKLKNRLTQ